ncbi:MAG: tetratricopeptide repeat protein, partial [Candidatus Eisenbacteria bacterium]|nr:tetratricopeptide repeat protein [Candidatus Eisenbacteria bacterium]
MNLGQFLLLVVILAAILAFVGVPWWMARRREEHAWDPARAYLAAIDALVRSRPASALAPLREVAKNDPENFGAYLRLGDLLRRMGYPDRAQRLHADLLARPISDPDDLRRAHESYVEDLLQQGKPEEAQRTAEKLIALDRKNPVALRALVQVAERRGDWEKALELLDEWDSVAPGTTVPTRVQMRVQMARMHMEAGRYREARKLLDEAVRLPGDGPLARIFLGDLLAREGKVEEAIEQWLQYVREHGYRSEQVFARLERAYFDLGRFGDLTQVYEGLASGRAGNLQAAIALADMHRRRGRIEESIRQLESVLEQQTDNRSARRQLIGGLLQVGRTEQALRELDHLLATSISGSNDGVCPSCGARDVEVWVRCERCSSWLAPA